MTSMELLPEFVEGRLLDVQQAGSELGLAPVQALACVQEGLDQQASPVWVSQQVQLETWDVRILNR